MPGQLNLYSLFEGRPGLTPSEGGHLAECAMVCFAHARRRSPITVSVTGNHVGVYEVVGPTVDERMRRCYADLHEASEYGACAVAAALTEAAFSLAINARAPRDGGGFDYYLAPLPAESDTQSADPAGGGRLIDATARLEVSGALSGGMTVLRARVAGRESRLARRPHRLPAIVVVVAFGTGQIELKRLPGDLA